MRGIIEPYSPKWPRTLDFLTPLKLQTKLDPKLDLYCYDGVLSVSANSSADMRKLSKTATTTELGINIDQTQISADKIRVRFGDVLPNTDDLRTQSEILNDVEDNMPIEIPDVVTHLRGVVEKIPKECEEIESMQASEYAFYEQIDRGNQTKKMRTMLNMPQLRNPHAFIKGDLIKFGAVKNLKDPLLRRMRGILKTTWAITDDKGYLELGPDILELEKALCTNKWWQDLGIVKSFSGDIEGRIFSGQVYWLAKREWLIAI